MMTATVLARRGHYRRRAAAALVCAVLVTAACGTRQSREDVAESEREQSPGAAAPATPESVDTEASGPSDEGSLDDASDSESGEDSAGEGAPARPAVTGANRSDPRSAAAAPTRPAGGSRSTAAGGGATDGKGGASPSPAAESPASPAPEDPVPEAPAPEAPAPANTDPIVIGSVGTYSGPAGGTLRPLPEGLQVWTKWTNDRGGIDGHPVKLSVVDDGGDAARYRSAVRDLVENKKIVALLAGAAPFTGKSMVEYMTEKRVPVIGEEGGSDWFYESPVYFPIGATGKTFLGPAVATGLARVVLPQGKSKWGSITCAEADACAAADQVWHDGGEAEKAGLEPVYRARASLAQPDFTAECLAARNAGAEVITTVMDDTSVSRIAASCARQDYQPIFNMVGPAASAKYKDDSNLTGSVMTIATFPWIKNDTPATAEFQEAMNKYFADLHAPGHAYGWASGKVLANAVMSTSQPTTPEGILQGLWTFRNETLGGLVMPLTWVEGQLAPRQPCWSAVIVREGSFEMLEGGRMQCKE